MKLEIKTWRFKNFIFKQIIISNICKISIYYFIDFSSESSTLKYERFTIISENYIFYS